ncbi:MAG: YciI family protein [Candidatus Heimdallarchaeota archaeon]
MSQSSEFLFLLKPPRKTFMENASQEEERIMQEHFEYLKELQETGKLILAGPCLDGVLGIVIFRANSLEEAAQIMNHDPSVEATLMRAELHPFRVSLFSPKAI